MQAPIIQSISEPGAGLSGNNTNWKISNGPLIGEAYGKIWIGTEWGLSQLDIESMEISEVNSVNRKYGFIETIDGVAYIRTNDKEFKYYKKMGNYYL